MGKRVDPAVVIYQGRRRVWVHMTASERAGYWQQCRELREAEQQKKHGGMGAQAPMQSKR